MTTKPSQWAIKLATDVIDQARQQWESELIEWLRGMICYDTNWPQYIATAIEAGEHREGK